MHFLYQETILTTFISHKNRLNSITPYFLPRSAYNSYYFRSLRSVGFSIEESCVAQYIYTMNRVSKMVPPKREILKDISLSFFPGAKIGVLGLNGAGKSTLLRIMAGVDKDFSGEARAQPGIKSAI